MEKVEAAAHALGLKIVLLKANSISEIDAAFAAIR